MFDLHLATSGWRKIIPHLWIAAIASTVIFYRLGSHPIYWWDEARVALNSLEMLRHPSVIVRYAGEPDLWNTKPALAIWLNAFSMWAFGINEWAIRLPATLAAIGTTVAVYHYTRRVSDNFTGLLAALILLGTGGFVEVHVARSADYDSLLVFFSTLATFSLFYAFETRRFWPVSVFGTCAVLTKGIAGATMLPGYALYALLSRKDVRAAVIPTLAGLAVVLLFYAARELAEPGYLAAMWRWDFVRYGAVDEGDSRSAYLLSLFWPWPLTLTEPWIKPLYTASAFPWSTVVLLSLYRPSRFAAYLWCCLGTFLVILTLGATRHGWYMAPAFPLIAVLCALGVRNSQVGKWLALAVALAFVGLNIWKAEKATNTQPLHFVYKTPDGKDYRGPEEFYEARTCPKSSATMSRYWNWQELGLPTHRNRCR